MPSLKDLRSRIQSVKNTQQITKTMKLVAAAKVRRARARCEDAQPYAEKMRGVLTSLAINVGENGHVFLSGKENVNVVRLVVVGSDRGLCGGFNANLCKRVIAHIKTLQAEGKTVQILCVGRKIRDVLKIDYRHLIIDTLEGIEKTVNFDMASGVAQTLINDFEAESCDEVVLFYNRFVNMVTQDPSMMSLIPFKVKVLADKEPVVATAVEYEPEEEEILDRLLPLNISIQLLQGMLESGAAEQAARITSMENATKNAGEMIGKLSLQYNRSRQAAITTELSEIVAGAEAV